MTWPPNSVDIGSSFLLLAQSIGTVIMIAVTSSLAVFFFVFSFPTVFKFFVDNFILDVHNNKYENGRVVAVRVKGRRGNPDRWVEVNEDGTQKEKTSQRASKSTQGTRTLSRVSRPSPSPEPPRNYAPPPLEYYAPPPPEYYGPPPDEPYPF